MAESSQAEAPVQIGGSKKLIVLVMIAALMSAGLAGGVAWFFAAKAEHSADAGEAGDAEMKPKKPVGPAIYYKVDPALVVNFDSHGVTRFLQVGIEISTRDPAAAEMLKQHDPQIRNDLLLLMGSQTEDTIKTLAAKEVLRAKALDTVRNVVNLEGGKGEKIENVFFTSFVMQ